jgi:hypothetical protein
MTPDELTGVTTSALTPALSHDTEVTWMVAFWLSHDKQPLRVRDTHSTARPQHQRGGRGEQQRRAGREPRHHGPDKPAIGTAAALVRHTRHRHQRAGDGLSAQVLEAVLLACGAVDQDV